MYKKRQLITALKMVDEAIQNPCVREDLIQDPDVSKMGEVMEMIDQAILVEQIRNWPNRTKA